MGMRTRDRGKAPYCLHRRNGRVLNQAQAVPQHAALGQLDQEGPLLDGEVRFCTNTDDIWFGRLDDVVVIVAQICDRRPLLLMLSTGVDWTIPNALQPTTATCTPIPTSCCRFAVVPGTCQFVYCHNGSR